MERRNHHWADHLDYTEGYGHDDGQEGKEQEFRLRVTRSLILTITRRNTTRLPRKRLTTGRTKLRMMPAKQTSMPSSDGGARRATAAGGVSLFRRTPED